MIRRLLLCACLASAAIACSGGDAVVQEDLVVVFDSMGVEIVQNPERAPDSTSWSLDTVPHLVIGDDESKGERYLFGFVSGAASLSDGRIVVADRQPPGVTMYDSMGEFLRQVGRVGQGPGEYTSVGGVVVLAGDTFAVRGGYVGRATQVFDPGGDFVRTLSAPLRQPDLRDGRYGQPSIVSFFTDGTVLAGASVRAAPGGLATEPRTPTVVESHRRLVRAQPGGDVLADFGEYPSGRWIRYDDDRQLPGNPGFLYQAEGYLPQPHAATHGTYVYLSDGDRFEISVYDAEARLSRIIRKTHTPAVIPPTWTDSRWSALVEGIEPSSGLAWMRRLPPPDIPEHAPAFDRMLFDVLGNLWVRSNPPAEALPPIWFVFDGAGVLQHSLRTDIDPLYIGADHFLTLLRDEYDVQAVAVYSLRKP